MTKHTPPLPVEQTELRKELTKSIYNVLNEYRSKAYGLVTPIDIDNSGYTFGHPVLPPNEQSFIDSMLALFAAQATAAQERAEHYRLEGALWIVKQLLKQNAHDKAALLDAKKQIVERLAAQPKEGKQL